MWNYQVKFVELVLFLYIRACSAENGDVTENEKHLIEAGCKERSVVYNKYDENTNLWSGTAVHDWYGDGKLLALGACIPPLYRPTIAPDEKTTNVFTTIENQNVRDVNIREETVTIDFTLAMLWADPMIRTNFSVKDLRNGGIALDRKAEKSIWQPDVYISNLSNHKQYVESRQTKSIKLLSENMTDEIYLQNMAINQTSPTHVRWSEV